jgi:two-component system sensor histidine kinase ChiS
MRILTLIYFTGLLLFKCTIVNASDLAPLAVKGVLDLREYDFRLQGPLKLEGEFEFYWNQMLDPAIDGDTGIVGYIRVPGSWNRLRGQQPEVTRYGFATYRLVLLLPPGVEELSFKIEDVYSASGYFLSGKAIDYLGFPGVNKYQTLIKYSRPLVTGTVSSQPAELLVKVSNFDHMYSGIKGGITMGLPGQMRLLREKELFRGHFLIGAFLIIGIYFLGLFLIRSEQYRLHFAILCILMALRVSMILELPFIQSLNLNGLTWARLDYMNIYFFAPFFTLMIRSIFPYEFPIRVFRTILYISAVFIVLVAISPVSLFSYSLPWFFVFFILVSLVFLYVVVLAWGRGRSHAPAFTIGLLVLFMGTLNDMLNEIDLIQTPYIVHYTMFIYLLVYAYIFADKSNHMHQQSEKLAREASQVKNNLEEQVEERTMELLSVSRQLEQQKKKLESSNRDLVEAMNARNRLFSIIGHDIRAPIGYTRQALEMMMENKEMPEQERDELLRMMASSSEVTYNLLDNLLVWGRTQTGRLKAIPTRFQLKALVDESLELVSIGIREKKLKVEVFISEEHYLEADRDHLYIVIRNLVSNAIKFTPEKGSIYISSKKHRGEVVVSIRDNGIGIPEAVRSKLFDARSYVSTGGTRGEKGSGLGLKICQEIIQANQGWIKIESGEGSGTTILFGIRSARKPA